MCAVGLDGHKFASLVQAADERRCHLQRRLPSGQHHVCGGIAGHDAHDFCLGHLCPLFVTGVAEGATQVAARKADKDGRGAHMEAFTLQGVENLVDYHGLKNDVLIARFDVTGRVALRLLESHLVTLGYLVGDPSGQVLRRGVKVEHLVQVTVVQLVLDEFLDMAEIDDHAVIVQLFCLAIDDGNPVMAVQVAAFAFIVEFQLVGKA